VQQAQRDGRGVLHRASPLRPPQLYVQDRGREATQRGEQRVQLVVFELV
jgi:hypothetical protein